MRTTENVTVTTPVPMTDAMRLLQLDATIELSRIELAELRQKYIALLPFATPDQFAEVRDAASREMALPEGHRVNVDFKLTSEQEQILRDVRAERRNHLTGNRDVIIQELLADSEQKLVSLKVRVGSKRTTTTARFEKSNVAPRAGLIAALRAMTADA